MLGQRKLVLDTLCEVYHVLRPWCDHEFWDFASHDLVPDSIYVFGRNQMVANIERIRNLCQDPRYTLVFGNSAEGSSTLIAQLRVLGIDQQVREGKILIISGGDLSAEYPYMLHEHFLTRILDYEENLREISRYQETYQCTIKPYKFLFLNGRARPHRKYLLERLRLSGLLDQSLWTMLDGRGSGNRIFSLMHEGVDLVTTNSPIRHLPQHYEVARYRGRNVTSPDYPHQFIKYDLFADEWGEIYLEAAPYIDTYFSLVTETVFDYPYSFRTEKIAKPLAMGHPWICASNRGFYRDMRRLGFQTFDKLVDERFDLIDNNQDRMDAVLDCVRDLCNSDLASFLSEAEPICKYNQQHLEHVTRQERRSFPARFIDYVTAHG